MANIPGGEVIADDLYAGGTDVVIAGSVSDDVVAAGRTVTVTGDVQGGLWA
ncbi:hypothetical protein [Deinococcus sp.]|uniref:hypothetical protein n=1 Tax=Deinococcus sp. TaxID=47478 RepID=UPI0028699F48|nr:hypothetical protein [Deinococcus sp.]